MAATTSTKPSLEAEVEVQARAQARLQMRAANVAAHENKPSEALTEKLDANLKKCTAFVKRLKDITEKQRESILKDLKTLKLVMYLEEVVGNLAENRFKLTADVDAAVQVCSALHCLYADFSPKLQAVLSKQMTPVKPEKDDERSARVLRQRSLLRFIAELFLVGVFPKPLIVVNALREVLDPNETLLQLQTVVQFVKTEGEEFTGIKPASGSRGPLLNESNKLLSPQQQDFFASQLKTYTKRVEQLYLDEYKTLKAVERENHNMQHLRGELTEEAKAQYEKALKTFERLANGLQSLSEGLVMDMPELPAEEETVTRMGQIQIVVPQIDEETIGGPFEDDEALAFHRSFIAIRSTVPAVLLEDQKGDDRKESDKEPAPLGSGIEDMSSPVEVFFRNLPNAMSTEAIDKAAVDFCYINNKASRRRLIKTTCYSGRGARSDMVAYYGRLIATLNAAYSDLAPAASAAVEEDFAALTKAKKEAEARLVNARLIGEFVKFEIMQPSVAFHAFKVLLDDFAGPNIDVFCALLETCGRYLLQTPATNVRMVNMLETLQKKKSALHFDARQEVMIDNAMTVCKPPDKSAHALKERPLILEYIRRLLLYDLTESTVESVFMSLRRLNWNDPQAEAFCVRVMSRPWTFKYSSIASVASVLSGIMLYHPSVAVSVVDSILEQIKRGMELNDYRRSQRRVAIVRYFGELYNYEVIESSLVFDVLFLLISFGHEGGRAVRGGKPSPLDAPDDFFRIRLVCTLLDTCGEYFRVGKLRGLLERYLDYFARYLYAKDPLPTEYDFMVTDMLEILRAKLPPSYEEACRRIAIHESSSAPAAEPESDSEDGGDVGSEDESGSSTEESDDDDDEDDEDDSESSSEAESEEDEEEGAAIFTGALAAPQVTEEEEEAFDRELQQMMADAGAEARRTVRSSNVESVVARSLFGAPERNVQRDASGNIILGVMLRKGAKPRTIAVPAASRIAQQAQKQEQVLLQEKEQIKRLTLQYEHQQRVEDESIFAPQTAPSRPSQPPPPAPRETRRQRSQRKVYIQRSELGRRPKPGH